MLTDTQIERYSRQLILPELGGRGQQALLSGSVSVFGTGEAASLTALYLAAAGVGTLQVAEVRVVAGLNPDVHVLELDRADAIDAVLRRTTVAVCANAAPAVCRAVNAAAIRHAVPLVWAGNAGSSAWVGAFAGHDRGSACHACAVSSLPAPDAPPAPGLRAVAAALAGTLAATTAVAALLGRSAILLSRLTLHALHDATVTTTEVVKDPACAACSDHTRSGKAPQA